MKKYFKYLIVLLLVAGAVAGGFFWTKDRLLKNPEVKSLAATPTQIPKPATSYSRTIGNFVVTSKEVEQEDGRPVIYFFGMSSCPHCVWEKPIAQKVFSQFKNEIVYNERFDSEEDMDVFEEYLEFNPNYGVPFLVLGGKYVRVGAGEGLGATEEESKKLEEEALTVLVCKLTEAKPDSVCGRFEEEIKALE